MSSVRTYEYKKKNGGAGDNQDSFSALIDNPASGARTNYAYDGQGRLCATYTGAWVTNADCASPPSGANRWVYDQAGNLTSTTWAGTTINQVSDYQDRLCTLNGSGCPATAQFSYSNVGNQLTTSNGHTFAYDVKDRVTTLDGVTKAYAGTDNTELVQTGTTVHRNWILGHVRDEPQTGNTVTYVRTPSGELVSRQEAGASTYYIYDGQRRIVALSGPTGVDYGRYSYDPYGAHTVLTSTGYAVLTANVYRYKSGWWQTATGGDVYKFGARYYDTAQSKWTQADPGHADVNQYRFVGDDPVNFSDSAGLSAEQDLGSAIGGALGSPGGPVYAGLGGCFGGSTGYALYHVRVDTRSDQKKKVSARGAGYACARGAAIAEVELVVFAVGAAIMAGSGGGA